ncbi:MAG: ATP-binding protein, partial [Stellaceae bacterium]
MSPEPVTANEFAALMARFAPFERRPHLAIAVSGGADSLALALLARRWAADAGGSITALTVDHRLRPESGAEAAGVAARLARGGIAHRILVREGMPPAANIEAAARAWRYRLLESWCGANGVLHLLT